MKLKLLFCFIITYSVLMKSQTHPIVIHGNGHVASLQMTSSEYSSWKTNNDYTNNAKRQSLIKDIYLKFKDDFDFIFLILNETSVPSGLPYGQLIQVSSNVTGLGFTPFDEASSYGSAGKLKGVMHLTGINFISSGPSLHELMHNWANFGISTEGTFDGVNFFGFKPHWGVTGGNTKGQLGGFKQSSLVNNGGGSYSVDKFGFNANGGNSVPYNELELYLMGMTPINSVSNFDVFTGITSFTSNPTTYTFQATTRTTHTPTTLETLLGARNPTYATSQKSFKLLNIVLTDTPLTEDQWNIVDGQSKRFGLNKDDGYSSYNFWEATGGRGTMDTGNLQNSIIGGSLGLEDLELNNMDLIIYPNPIKDIVTIEVKDAIAINEITLYNLNGLKLTHLTLSKNQNKTVINLSSYSSGIYFLQFKDSKGKIYYKKIIKR